jgi:hypothetical protein
VGVRGLLRGWLMGGEAVNLRRVCYSAPFVESRDFRFGGVSRVIGRDGVL